MSQQIGNEHAAQFIGIPQVPCGPVPAMASTGLMEANGQHWVGLFMSTPTGIHAFHLDAPMADRLGDSLKKLAEQARTGIVVPGGGAGLHVVDGGQDG